MKFPNVKIEVSDREGESKPGADIYVDGNRIGEIGGAVIKDRKIMANDGILVVIINVDMKKRELLIKPNITTRGFILVNENQELIKEIENKCSEIVTGVLSKRYNLTDLKNTIILELNLFFWLFLRLNSGKLFRILLAFLIYYRSDFR